MHESIPDNSVVTGLYWLAFILTGCEDISVNVTAEALSMAGNAASGNAATCDLSDCHPSDCHRSGSTRLRRAVITQSIAAQESELRWARDRYQRQTDYGFESELRAGLDGIPDFLEVQNALLAIDLFPRHVLLLTVFEGFSVQDAARCLDSNEQAICDARSDGLKSLTRNMALIPSL